MSDINRVTIAGTVDSDPDIGSTTGGVSRTSFRVLTVEKVNRPNGETQAFKTWHNVVTWRSLADECMQVRRGDTVFLEGKLRVRSYEKNGAKQYITEIVADSVKIIPAQKPAREQVPENVPPEHIDDLPF